MKNTDEQGNEMNFSSENSSKDGVNQNNIQKKFSGRNYILKKDYFSQLSRGKDYQLEKTIKEIKSKDTCLNYQNQIKQNPLFANLFLYPFLKSNMLELINDPNGNYLYQEFIKVLNRENLENFIDFISDNSEILFWNKYGTRIPQKLIEMLYNDSYVCDRILRIIKENVVKMCVHEYATHIIQKCLISFNETQTKPIYEEICNNFLSIAVTKSGCCVIQRCLMHGNTQQKLIMITLIFNNIGTLFTDQFGNYIIQFIILLNKDWIIKTIFEIQSKNLINLCQEKYSSNVIEKFFEIKNKELVNEIGNFILKRDITICSLLCGEYGNYIIQKILSSVTDNGLINRIIRCVIQNEKKIKRNHLGKIMLYKLKEEFPFVNFFKSYSLDE